MTETLQATPLEIFAVDKATGTHADTLAAVGLADLLAATRGDIAVRLSGEERRFRIAVEPPLDESNLGELIVGPGYPYLQPKSTAPVPAGADVVDYQAEREKFQRFKELSQALRSGAASGATDPALREAIEATRPREDWRLLQVMYMLTNHVAPNAVHAALVAMPPADRRQVIAEALRQLATGERVSVPWKADAVQLFNPLAAKGYARLKPDGTNRNDKTKEQWTDPFIEWLRYRGYFQVACPFFLGSKGEHIRVYTPIPADTSLAVLRRAAIGLRNANLWGSAPKLDALAVIWLADFLVRQSREGQAAAGRDEDQVLGFRFTGRTPAAIIEGVAITQYQSLGSARAVSALATLATPGWFVVSSPEDAAAWLAILDEHRRVVRGLDDHHSDEIGLLITYRRFLERRGLAAVETLLDFMGGYGQFVLRAWEAKRRVRVFRTTNFRRLLEGMAPSFAAIVSDPGFDAVARAVRRATVQAQFLKANGANDVREIRYDLLPEIRRARTVGEAALIEVVSDFVAKYNAENARRRELKKQTPANVHTDEFARFLQLIDSHGAAVIGALLAAYGTCVEPREEGVGASDDDKSLDTEQDSQLPAQDTGDSDIEGE